MGDLETSLTWLEGTKLFQDGLYNVIKSRGKKHESPGEQKLSALLPNEDENTTHQIADLLGKLARNGGSKWKTALDSAQISIIKTRGASYKISFQYRVLPTIQFRDCIPEKKKNLSIINIGVMEHNGQLDVHGQPQVQETMEVIEAASGRQ